MDLSKISSKDLLYIQNNELDKVSDFGLAELQLQMSKPDIGDDARNFKLSKDTAKAGTRFRMGLEDPFVGVTQLAAHGIDKLRGKPSEFTQSFDKYVKSREEEYAPVEGVDWARIGGNIINPANLVAASRIPAATSLMGRVGIGAGTGAGFAATAPVTSEEYGKGKLEQIGTGSVVGSLIPLAGSAVSRVISPKASTNPQLQLLKEEGITPTLGQTLGGRANTYEEIATKLPIAGDIINKARNLNTEKFRIAVLNKTLKPLGDKVPANLKGREAIDYVAQKLDDSYTSTLDNLGAIKLDNTFNNQMSELTQMINKSKLDKASKDEFGYMVEQIKSGVNNNGFITSETYKALESELSTNAAKFGRSDSIYASKLKDAAKQMKSNLQDLLSRHAEKMGNVNGENLANKLKNTNQSWAMFKRVQKAAGADMGEFTPKQFNAAVKATDISKDKGNFARGKAIFQDLSEAGKTVLGDDINTNPLIRATLNLGGLGFGLMNPQLLMGLLGTGAVYNPYSQKAVNALLTSRPSFAPQLANQVKNISPYISSGMPSFLRNDNK